MADAVATSRFVLFGTWAAEFRQWHLPAVILVTGFHERFPSVLP
jgi:hypothetical protein